MDSLDEEKEDELVQKITTEARSNRKHYDLSDFTHAKAREQTIALDCFQNLSQMVKSQKGH